MTRDCFKCQCIIHKILHLLGRFEEIGSLGRCLGDLAQDLCDAVQEWQPLNAHAVAIDETDLPLTALHLRKEVLQAKVTVYHSPSEPVVPSIFTSKNHFSNHIKVMDHHLIS